MLLRPRDVDINFFMSICINLEFPASLRRRTNRGTQTIQIQNKTQTKQQQKVPVIVEHFPNDTHENLAKGSKM